jgi:hypothetical protein
MRVRYLIAVCVTVVLSPVVRFSEWSEGGIERFVSWLIWLVPCGVYGHRIPVVNKGHVGYCHRCRKFFEIGKGGRVLGEVDMTPREGFVGRLPRVLDRRFRRGLEHS